MNLKTYSEEFDNAAWSETGGNVSANVETSPIGDQTADKWVPSTSNSYHYVKATVTGSAEDRTYSVYAKQSGYRYLLINTSSGSATGNGPVVDLQDGVVVDNFTATYPVTVTDAGNGWWRIALTYTGAGSNIHIDHNPFPTSTIATYAGDGTSGVLLWGAQLEEGTTATPYIKTEATIGGAARYENGELVLEEARTNLIRYNSGFNTAVPGIFGSGGSLPSNWAVGQQQPGTQLEIIGTGTELGLEYIDLRFFGTPTAVNRWLIQPSSNDTLSVLANDEYASSVYAKLIAGSMPTFVRWSVFGGAAGANLHNTLTNDFKRHSGVGSFGSDSTNRKPRLDVGANSLLSPYDFTIRVAAFQAELGSYPTS